jgi:hypothetical protein
MCRPSFCQICGDTRNLDQHHIQAKGMGGSKALAIEAPDNKITLCRTCHHNIHEGGWLLQRSEHELRVVDRPSGELIMRRLYDKSFDASTFLHQLTRAESSLEQLVETFASARSLARCVRLATQNAYLTLQSHLVNDNGSKVAMAERANSG